MGFIKQGTKPTGKIEEVGTVEPGPVANEKEVIEKIAFKKPEEKKEENDN